MSLLSDFYVASPEDAIAYDASRALPDSVRAEFSGLTYNELAELWAVLQGTEATPRHAEASSQSWLLLAASASSIASQPSSSPRSHHLTPPAFRSLPPNGSKTGELAYLSCQPSHVTPIIDAASRLARNAQQNGKSLYLWMCV